MMEFKKPSTGTVFLITTISLVVGLGLWYVVKTQRADAETVHRLISLAPIGATKADVMARLGVPAQTLKAEMAPRDYYWRGYSRPERPISNEVLIFNGPYVDYRDEIGFRNHIIYVYIDNKGRVEFVFVAKG